MRLVVCGMLIGVGMALLLAPMSGRRVRALIKDRFARARGYSREFIGARREHLRVAISGAREKPHRITEELDDAMQAAAGG